MPKYVDRLGRNVRQKIGNCRVGSGASGPIDRILRFNGLQIPDVITSKQKKHEDKWESETRPDKTGKALICIRKAHLQNKCFRFTFERIYFENVIQIDNVGTLQ